MIIPLGIKAYKRSDGFVPEVRLVNLYLEKDESGISPDNTMRLQRPGLLPVANLNSTIRGLHYFTKRNERLAVASGTLYANETAVGPIGGSGTTPMASTAFLTAILGDDIAYAYNGSTITRFTTPTDRQITDIEQLNGYVLFGYPDGRFYWAVPGSTSVDTLDFANAESSPDGIVAIRRLVDELWIFGSEITEVWQATGDADAPFQRVSGRQYERGCLARDTVRRFDNSVVWVGDDGNVYRGGAVPQIISDNGIAERIRGRDGALSAWVFGWDGHKFYVLRIPGQGTFAYDASTASWCEFASTGNGTWIPHVGYEVNGEVYAGSSLGGNIWRLGGYLDDGQPFERIVTGTAPITGKRPRNDSLTVGVGASEDCAIRVRWRDGQDDYPGYYDAIDVRAPFDLATMYRLGMPDQPYRTWEVSCVDPAAIRIAGLVANEGWE